MSDELTRVVRRTLNASPWSLRQIAEATQPTGTPVSHATLSNIKTGKVRATVRAAKAVMTALSVLGIGPMQAVVNLNAAITKAEKGV